MDNTTIYFPWFGQKRNNWDKTTELFREVKKEDLEKSINFPIIVELITMS